jgi:hypothetical protein
MLMNEKTGKSSGKFQFGLATLMIIVTLCAVELSFYSWVGPHGLLIIPDAWIIGVMILKCLRITSFCVQIGGKLTFLEIIVIVGILLVLHGLFIPPVDIP